MRTIAVLNQKGGVGKTTSVVNLAAALAGAGSKVVVVDFDPQAHLTIHLGLEPQTVQFGSYKVLTQSAEFEQQILLMRPNLWLLPANINLVGAESELVSVVGRETILREAIQSSRDKFDYCLIDCGPSLGLLTLNALAAADDVLIPLQPHFLALRGFGKLLQTVELVNKRINPNLKVKWILLCMFDSRASLPSEVRADIEQFLNKARGTNCPWAQAQILPVYIRQNIKLAEAPSYGKTIFEYEQNCHGSEDYRKVAEIIHAQFQPSIPPDAQPVTISEIQDEPSAPSALSPQPGSQVPLQPSTQPAGDVKQDQLSISSVPLPKPDSQESPEPENQLDDTDENQTQPPIEIKSIPQSDSETQSSELTQTKTEKPDTN
ncbi:MAG TPA: AAA family ATPase [Sedimentisphaerales bacterium]|nr:AAA family ATPase [Sedimentisphaerales bacterium]